MGIENPNESPKFVLEKQREVFEGFLLSSGAISRREHRGAKDPTFVTIAPANPFEIISRTDPTEKQLLDLIDSLEHIAGKKEDAERWAKAWLTVWLMYEKKRKARIEEILTRKDEKRMSRYPRDQDTYFYDYRLNKELGYIDIDDPELEEAIREIRPSEYVERDLTHHSAPRAYEIGEELNYFFSDDGQTITYEIFGDKFKSRITAPTVYEAPHEPPKSIKSGDNPQEILTYLWNMGVTGSAAVLARSSLLQIPYLRGIHFFKEKGLQLESDYEKRAFEYASAGVRYKFGSFHDDGDNQFWANTAGGVLARITQRDPVDGRWVIERMKPEEVDEFKVLAVTGETH